jgi:hypothetical protein
MMAGSAGMSVMGSIQQGQAAQAEGNYKASLDDHQASVARDDAMAQSQLIRKQLRFSIASSDVAAAGSGVVVGEGSAGEANRQIYQDAEHDAHIALLNGDRQSSALQAEGQLERMKGNNKASSAYMDAAGSALGGAYKINTALEAAGRPTMYGWKTLPRAGG